MIDLFAPTYTKYKNNHMYKLINSPIEQKLNYGDWGIIACESGVITSEQLRAAKDCITRAIKKQGKVWIKILPDHIISKKPKSSRMGSGKGKGFKWVFILKPGQVILEVTKIPLSLMINSFKFVKSKLPVKVKLLIDYKTYN